MAPNIGLDSDEYVSKKPLQSLERAFELLFEIQGYLTKLYGDAKITGYFARVLKDDEDVEYEDLDPEILNEEDGNKFPSIWVNVTYKYGDQESLAIELNKLAHDFDLESI
jgi:hypothetical protein